MLLNRKSNIRDTTIGSGPWRVFLLSTHLQLCLFLTTVKHAVYHTREREKSRILEPALSYPHFGNDLRNESNIFFGWSRYQPKNDGKLHQSVTSKVFGWCKNHLNFITNQNKPHAITLININYIINLFINLF